jgi:Tfp pilus assembly protein PilO
MDNNKQAITGVKKRQQIKQANKLVFIWVAAAGVFVAIAIVLSQMMIKQLMFNLEVIGLQTSTNNTLVQNAETYAPLRTEVSKLIANKELNELRIDKSETGDNSLQVVIDAMPTVDDRLSLAASLQQTILNKSGVRIEQLSFPEEVALVDATAVQVAPTQEGIGEIPFTFKILGSYEQIKKTLEDIQLSIRPISITNIQLAGASSEMTAEVTAKTFYAVPPTTALKKETKL